MIQNHPCSAFFIVGTGRCGTNLLRNMLLFHPDVWIARETHWLPVLFRFYGLRKISCDEFFHVLDSVYMARGKTAFQRMMKMNKLAAGEFKEKLVQRISSSGCENSRDMMDAFYTLLAEHNNALVWGDKTPDYGLCMNTLSNIWPDAKFVHIARDGRDVALSMSKVPSFRYLVAWGINHWYAVAYKKQYEMKRDDVEGPLPLDAFFELWKSRVLRIRDEKNRLKGKNYLEIRYEDVLREPLKALLAVAGFLQLPGESEWVEDACRIVETDKLDKNRCEKTWMALTEKYENDLQRTGFLDF